MACTTVARLCILGSTDQTCLCEQRKTYIHTRVQRIVSRSDSGPPDRRRQRSAFPPNYVHSLDSTHLLMTALRCGRLGECTRTLVTAVCTALGCRCVPAWNAACQWAGHAW